MTSSLLQLTGELVLRPHLPAGQNLQSTRPALAPRIAAGCSARALPERLASVLSQCGAAHRICCTLALRTLLPDAWAGAQWEAGPVAQRLASGTLAEHVRRVALDWTRLGDDAMRRDILGTLAGSPVLAPDFTLRTDAPAARAWLERHWLGTSAQEWLERWNGSAASAWDQWVMRSDTPLARLLKAMGGSDVELDLPADEVLEPPAGAQEALAWIEQLQMHPEFALRPRWSGLHLHTGCWSRQSQTRLTGKMNASLLLGARVAEMARLCLSDGQQPVPLAFGAHALGRGWALAWVEMARGLLVHVVRMEHVSGDRPVQRCVVIAPTEWNFHPRGVAARALAARPDAHALLVMALDPCVGYRVEGTGLPQNGGPAHEKGSAHA